MITDVQLSRAALAVWRSLVKLEQQYPVNALPKYEGRAEEDRVTEYMVLKARPKGLKVPSNPKQDRNQ